ncbi:hypothetical protein [Pseudomonas sp.]|uniref:hypothetical protein n=1 Tax=Pseudomonas sp. TaxID=306 RepID=UPI0028AF5291|nr:hypothetical protein [Pseudomonas sp.]
MSFTDNFIKPLALSTIPLFLGSLIFVGVIESYKDESTLKLKILEEYFKPSREISSACLKTQNELYLQYPMYSSSLRLFSEEMTHLIDNPSLNSNAEYEIILKTLAENHFESAKKLKDLQEKVEICKVQAFHSLEILSLVSGTFDEFTELSKSRAGALNSAYETRSIESKENTSNVKITDMQTLMRGIATTNLASIKGQNEFKQKMADILPFIERYSEIMSRTETQMYKSEGEFYSKARAAASTQISNKFKGGFLAWLF